MEKTARSVVHRPEAVLHVGHDLELDVADDQRRRQQQEQDPEPQRQDHDAVGEDVVEGRHHQRSMSPTTKNMLPRMAIMSGTKAPRSMWAATLMLENDGVRIFNR